MSLSGQTWCRLCGSDVLSPNRYHGDVKLSSNQCRIYGMGLSESFQSRTFLALAILYSSAYLYFELRRCSAASFHEYSVPIVWPTRIPATTYSSNPTQNLTTGQQVRVTLSWAIHVQHSTFCLPTLAVPRLSVNFYMSSKSQLYGPLHLSELFFLQPEEDFVNFDPLNANLLDFHPRYVPPLLWECISFLTIITSVLGSTVLLSRSSQEETPSKLEPDYVIACTSNNPFAWLVNCTMHLLDTSIGVYIVIYWVSC